MKSKDIGKDQQIFDATLALVEEFGLTGISMEAVAKKAKVATGTVYIYFKSKDELLNKLYVHVKLNLVHALFDGWDETAPIKVLFTKLCNGYLGYYINNYPQVVFMRQFTNSTYVTEITKEAVKGVIDPMLNLFERGKKEMLFKDIDTKLMVTFLNGVVVELSGFVRQQPAAKRKQYYDIIVGICWDAIKA